MSREKKIHLASPVKSEMTSFQARTLTVWHREIFVRYRFHELPSKSFYRTRLDACLGNENFNFQKSVTFVSYVHTSLMYLPFLVTFTRYFRGFASA